jgi:hypothetical protein
MSQPADPTPATAPRTPAGIPDLEMLVSGGGPGPCIGLTCVLRASDPALQLKYQKYSISFTSSPEPHIAGHCKELGRLPLGTDEERAVARRRLSAFGKYLWKLLPADLQERFWSLQHRIRTVQILSDESFIPWELLKLQGPRANEPEEGPFLGEAFAVTRWLQGFLPETTELPMRRIGLIVPSESYAQGAREEREDLLALGASKLGRDVRERTVHEITARTHPVLQSLAAGDCDGWHFAGHGKARGESPGLWEIHLEEDQRLRPNDLQEVAGLGGKRPLVFLNACETGGSGRDLLGLGGWPASFLAAGAGAFLGTYWTVSGDAARAFSQGFYRRFLSGVPMGEAVRQTRQEVRARFPGDPAWLAYTAFAHPLARCPGTAPVATLPAPESPETLPLQVERLWASRMTDRAWSSNKSYSELSRRLVHLEETAFSDLALTLVRWIVSPPGQPLEPDLFQWAEEGLACVPGPSPSPLVVQAVSLGGVSPEEAGASQLRRCRAAIQTFRASGLRTRAYLLVYSGEPRSEIFRLGIEEDLRALRADFGIERAEAWGRQKLLKDAFSTTVDHLLALAGKGRLSALPAMETFESRRGDPLDQVPMKRSLLIANQHQLLQESEVTHQIDDPLTALLQTPKDRISLLLGGFGFGKTTAVIRALRRGMTQVLYAPGAALGEELRGTKDLLFRCVDTDNLLADFPEEDREVYRLLLRTALDYIMKDPGQPLALILDGLDESAFLSRPGGFHELFNSLWEVRVPIVLTMRTEFWQSQRAEFEAILGKIASHGEQRVQRIRTIELSSWELPQIRQFVGRFRQATTDEAGRQRLAELEVLIDRGEFERIYGDIPRRPLFLRFIAESVAELGVPSGHMGRARLMRDWALRKIWRDIQEPRAAGGKGRLPLLEKTTAATWVEVVWEAMIWAAHFMTRPFERMLELTPSCSFDQIGQATPRLLEIREPLALFLHSLLRPVAERSGAQPVRLSFAHRAYQEFFLAWFLLAHPEKRGDFKLPDSVTAWMRDIAEEELLGGGS